MMLIFEKRGLKTLFYKKTKSMHNSDIHRTVFYQSDRFDGVFNIHRVYKEQHKPMHDSSGISVCKFYKTSFH